jgi:hypothetical protein
MHASAHTSAHASAHTSARTSARTQARAHKRAHTKGTPTRARAHADVRAEPLGEVCVERLLAEPAVAPASDDRVTRHTDTWRTTCNRTSLNKPPLQHRTRLATMQTSPPCRPTRSMRRAACRTAAGGTRSRGHTPCGPPARPDSGPPFATRRPRAITAIARATCHATCHATCPCAVASCVAPGQLLLLRGMRHAWLAASHDRRARSRRLTASLCRGTRRRARTAARRSRPAHRDHARHDAAGGRQRSPLRRHRGAMGRLRGGQPTRVGCAAVWRACSGGAAQWRRGVLRAEGRLPFGGDATGGYDGARGLSSICALVGPGWYVSFVCLFETERGWPGG